METPPTDWHPLGPAEVDELDSRHVDQQQHNFFVAMRELIAKVAAGHDDG